MYRKRYNLILGFHGCDKEIRDRLINYPDKVKRSNSKYDWLGTGFYVWENNFARARQWAEERKVRGLISVPSVLGVVFLLDNCLDFTDTESTDFISSFHRSMKQDFISRGIDLPQNLNAIGDYSGDFVKRELDCATIEYMHQQILEKIKFEKAVFGQSDLKQFDTVRGAFSEGTPVYEGARITAKNHIQICIRNMNCIKGFFIPRERDNFPFGKNDD